MQGTVAKFVDIDTKYNITKACRKLKGANYVENDDLSQPPPKKTPTKHTHTHTQKYATTEQGTKSRTYQIYLVLQTENILPWETLNKDPPETVLRYR